MGRLWGVVTLAVVLLAPAYGQEAQSSGGFLSSVNRQLERVLEEGAAVFMQRSWLSSFARDVGVWQRKARGKPRGAASHGSSLHPRYRRFLLDEVQDSPALQEVIRRGRPDPLKLEGSISARGRVGVQGARRLSQAEPWGNVGVLGRGIEQCGNVGIFALRNQTEDVCNGVVVTADQREQLEAVSDTAADTEVPDAVFDAAVAGVAAVPGGAQALADAVPDDTALPDGTNVTDFLTEAQAGFIVNTLGLNSIRDITTFNQLLDAAAEGSDGALANSTGAIDVAQLLVEVPTNITRDALAGVSCFTRAVEEVACVCPLDYTGANCTVPRPWTCTPRVVLPGYETCLRDNGRTEPSGSYSTAGGWSASGNGTVVAPEQAAWSASTQNWDVTPRGPSQYRRSAHGTPQCASFRGSTAVIPLSVGCGYAPSNSPGYVYSREVPMTAVREAGDPAKLPALFTCNGTQMDRDYVVAGVEALGGTFTVDGVASTGSPPYYGLTCRESLFEYDFGGPNVDAAAWELSRSAGEAPAWPLSPGIAVSHLPHGGGDADIVVGFHPVDFDAPGVYTGSVYTLLALNGPQQRSWGPDGLSLGGAGASMRSFREVTSESLLVQRLGLAGKGEEGRVHVEVGVSLHLNWSEAVAYSNLTDGAVMPAPYVPSFPLMVVLDDAAYKEPPYDPPSVVGLVLGLLATAVVLGVAVWYYRRREKQREAREEAELRRVGYGMFSGDGGEVQQGVQDEMDGMGSVGAQSGAMGGSEPPPAPDDRTMRALGISSSGEGVPAMGMDAAIQSVLAETGGPPSDHEQK